MPILGGWSLSLPTSPSLPGPVSGWAEAEEAEDVSCLADRAACYMSLSTR